VAEDTRIPLLEHEPSESPVFTAVNLLEAARIRKGLPKVTVPAGCLLDFDGELVQHLADTGRAGEDSAWPCFHTRLFRWRAGSAEYGVIGGTIGAPFAVLVAEELFALGCRALVSISSAGLVAEACRVPCPRDEHDGNPGGGLRERRRRGTCGFPFRVRCSP